MVRSHNFAQRPVAGGHHHPKQRSGSLAHPKALHPKKKAEKSKKSKRRGGESDDSDEDFDDPFALSDNDSDNGSSHNGSSHHGKENGSGKSSAAEGSDGDDENETNEKNKSRINNNNKSKKKEAKEKNNKFLSLAELALLEEEDPFRGFRLEEDDDDDEDEEEEEEEEQKNENHAPFSSTAHASPPNKKEKKKQAKRREDDDEDEDEEDLVMETLSLRNASLTSHSTHTPHTTASSAGGSPSVIGIAQRKKMDTHAMHEMHAMDALDTLKERYAEGDEELRPKNKQRERERFLAEQEREKIERVERQRERDREEEEEQERRNKEKEKEDSKKSFVSSEKSDFSLSSSSSSVSPTPAPPLDSLSPSPAPALQLTTGKFQPPKERETHRHLPTLSGPPSVTTVIPALHATLSAGVSAFKRYMREEQENDAVSAGRRTPVQTPTPAPMHTRYFARTPTPTSMLAEYNNYENFLDESEREQERQTEREMVREIAKEKERQRAATLSAEGVPAAPSLVERIEQNVVAISIGKALPFATGLMIHPSLCLVARHCIEAVNVSELIVRANFQKPPNSYSNTTREEEERERAKEREREREKERYGNNYGGKWSDKGRDNSKFRDIPRSNRDRDIDSDRKHSAFEREREKERAREKIQERMWRDSEKEVQRLRESVRERESARESESETDRDSAIDFWSHLDVLGIVEESLELDYTILLLRMPVQNFQEVKLHVKPFIPPLTYRDGAPLSETDKMEIARNIATESAVFLHHPYGWTRQASLHVALDVSMFVLQKETLPSFRDRDRDYNSYRSSRDEVFAMHCLAPHFCSSAYPVRRVREGDRSLVGEESGRSGVYAHSSHSHTETRYRESEIIAEMTGVLDQETESANELERERDRERERDKALLMPLTHRNVSSKGSAKMSSKGSAKLAPIANTHAALSLHNIRLLTSFPSQSTHCHHTTALFLSQIYAMSPTLQLLYDKEGKYLNRSLPESFARKEFEKVSMLPRSEASKVYHNYVEAMKQKPKSFFSANQRFPRSLVQLTLHHIIPKSNMEFLWLLSRTCSEINEALLPLAWSKRVHEISLEGILLLRSMIENNAYLKNLWESGVYAIEDSVSGFYVITPFAVEKLQGVVQYHEQALARNAALAGNSTSFLASGNVTEKSSSVSHSTTPSHTGKPIVFQALASTPANVPAKIFLTHDELHTVRRILSAINLNESIPDHVNREGSICVNNVVWAPWNLFMGPSDRPIGSRPGYDAKEAFVMESTKPLSFPSNLWEKLVRLNALLTEAWKGCMGRVVTVNNSGKSMSQLRISSINRGDLVHKFVACLHEINRIYTQICVDSRSQTKQRKKEDQSKSNNTATADEKDSMITGETSAESSSKVDGGAGAEEETGEIERDYVHITTDKDWTTAYRCVVATEYREKERCVARGSAAGGKREKGGRVRSESDTSSVGSVCASEEEEIGYRSDASVRSVRSVSSVSSVRSVHSNAGSIRSERGSNKESNGSGRYKDYSNGSNRYKGSSRNGSFNGSDPSFNGYETRLTRAEKKSLQYGSGNDVLDNRRKKIETLSFDDMKPYTLYLRLIKAFKPHHRHHHVQQRPPVAFGAIEEERETESASFSQKTTMSTEGERDSLTPTQMLTSTQNTEKKFDATTLLLLDDDESSSLSRKEKNNNTNDNSDNSDPSHSVSPLPETHSTSIAHNTPAVITPLSLNALRERDRESAAVVSARSRTQSEGSFVSVSSARETLSQTEGDEEDSALTQPVTLLVCSYREETEQDARHLTLHTFTHNAHSSYTTEMESFIPPLSSFLESTKSSMKVIDFAFSNGEDLYNIQRIAALVKEQETQYKVSLDAKRAAAILAQQQQEQAEREKEAERQRKAEEEGEGEREGDSLKSELDDDGARSVDNHAIEDEFRLADEDTSRRHNAPHSHANTSTHTHEGDRHHSERAREGYNYSGSNHHYDRSNNPHNNNYHNHNNNYNNNYNNNSSSRYHSNNNPHSSYNDPRSHYHNHSQPAPHMHVNRYSTIEPSPQDQVLLLRLVKQVNKILREHNFIGTYKLRVNDKDGEPAWALMPPLDTDTAP